MIAVEGFAGTLSVSLYALTRRLKRPCQPFVGFMGSKRRWAPQLAAALFGDEAPDEVIVIDAGPWGDVWQVLASGQRGDVVKALKDWRDRSLPALWEELSSTPPFAEPGKRVAQYLALQARVCGSLPVWWQPEGPCFAMSRKGYETRAWQPAQQMHAARWVQGDHEAHRHARMKASSTPRSGGMFHVDTLIERVEAVPADVLARLTVVHGDVRSVTPIPGARVLLDPPYVGAPLYAASMERAEVLRLALRWATSAERVLVCEGEALPLDGWASWCLASNEVVTAYGVCVAPHEQLRLPWAAP